MDIEDRRNIRKIELKMWAIVKEIARFIMFAFLVLLLAYIQRNPNQYFTNRFMKVIGFDEEYINSIVLKPPDVFDYVTDVIEKGVIDANATNFFLNKRGVFITKPRLRQWRIKPNQTCLSITQRVRCKPRLETRAYLDTRRYREGWLEPGYYPKAQDDNDFPEWNFDEGKRMGSYQLDSEDLLYHYLHTMHDIGLFFYFHSIIYIYS